MRPAEKSPLEPVGAAVAVAAAVAAAAVAAVGAGRGPVGLSSLVHLQGQKLYLRTTPQGQKR